MKTHEQFVLVPIPRGLLAAATVEFVSQHTSEQTFGIPAERFRKLCKTGAWLSKRDGHLWLAKADDVRAYIERDMKNHKRLPKSVSDLDAELELVMPRRRRRPPMPAPRGG